MFDICLGFYPFKNQKFMQIVLIGYMGSGKTSIGKKLAEKLQLDFIDLDDYIEEKEQTSINKIFEAKGEIYFRKLENKLLKELISSDRAVVLAVGGGTPCYANNSELITASSTSVYLKTSIHELYDRLVKQKQNRPLIKDLKDDDLKEFIAKHLFERSFYYEKAQLEILTDGKSEDALVDEIILNMQRLHS